MGLGSIVGTGVFVSIGIAAGIAGASVILAVVLAAVLATCNALSSAQLAASHPVSGGTYEYGYKYLYPWMGFLAGWMFLIAKSASAAVAALGFAGYSLALFGVTNHWVQVALAAVAVLVLTMLVASGIRRTNTANVVIVSMTIGTLTLFCLAGIPSLWNSGGSNLQQVIPTTTETTWTLLEATALMFVAFTGYGRIATLGEEVRDPQTTIPQAIVVTLGVSAALYIAVAIVGIGSVGAEAMFIATQQQAAPLEIIASTFGIPGIRLIVAAGAVTAMLGVLLNLILGLSRVLLAMGRRADMPATVSQLDPTGSSPYIAVVVIGVVILGLVLLGDVKLTWSLSATTVLIYYAFTNLAALQLPKEQRLYPAVFAWIGLLGCLSLAFWVERSIWLVNVGLIALGVTWHLVAQRSARRRSSTEDPNRP